MKWLFLGAFCLLQPALALAAEPLTLFSYQQKPPYVIEAENGQGLYFELAEQLNARLPQYRFTVRELPRNRIDHLLARHTLEGLVVGASPDWFPDAAHYLWTEPFIDDANLLVSRGAGINSVLSLNQLNGLRVGLVRGHRYPELESLIEARQIIREDGVSEKTNLLRLSRGWIDATVVGKRTLDFYFNEQRGLRREVHVAQPPIYRYRRHILVPAAYAPMLPSLNRALDDVLHSDAWQSILARYR